MAEKTRNTGPFTAKNTPSIDETNVLALKKQKSFKGAAYTDTEWLTKKNAVREKIDPFYSWDKPGEPR